MIGGFFQLGIIWYNINMSVSKRKKESGFTFTELLVVMFILSLLSTMVLISYRNNQKGYLLSQSAQKLVSDIRKAQNMAISGVDISGGNYYGFGIYVLDNATSYILYGDEDGDSIYQPSDTTIETVNFSGEIRIGETAPLLAGVDVFFRSPNPITYIDGDNLAGKTATITLEIIGTSSNKPVVITTAGLIEVR